MLDQIMSPLTFMKLPPELHLEIISDIPSSALENLRSVCSAFNLLSMLSLTSIVYPSGQ